MADAAPEPPWPPLERRRRRLRLREPSPVEPAEAAGGGRRLLGTLGDLLTAAGAGPAAVPVALAALAGAAVAGATVAGATARTTVAAVAVLTRLALDRGRVDDAPLRARRDALVVVQVLGRRVGLLRLVERQVERLVDHLPAVDVRPVDEGDRGARGAGPAGAADPVHVGLVVLGTRVVDDVRDTGHVDAAGRDVGADQDEELVLAEPGQRLLAGDLRHVAVQGAGLEAALGEVVGDPLGGALGAREDDHLAGVLGLEDPADHLRLVEVVGQVDELRGRGDHRGVVRRLGADVHRVPHVVAGEPDDRGRHGRREQHRLAGLGRHRDELLDVRQEAEVEHLVGLVEDQRVHVREVERPAVGQVDEAARGADDDVDAGLERVELRVVADAAVDGEDAQAEVLAGEREVARDLERELTGRGDDERLRLALRHVRVRRVLGRDAALEHRDAEGERLAGARAGLADQVGAHQGDREGHLLDGEGGGDAGAVEGVADVGKDPELTEGGGSDDLALFGCARTASTGVGREFASGELCRRWRRPPRTYPATRARGLTAESIGRLRA